MATIAVHGASGFTGRLIVEQLAAAGHSVIAIGRDEAQVLAAVPEQVAGVVVRQALSDDLPALVAALEGADVVVNAAGPFVRTGQTVAHAAVAAQVHYVDITGEQPFIRWLYKSVDVPAQRAGITMVPAAGYDFLPGDLLASVAASKVVGARDIHVSYAILGSRRFGPRSSLGTRRTLALLIGAPCLAFVGSEEVEEIIGEARRLAWFPRPVGPRHAASVAGGEALFVPRHVPGVSTVRTYLAVGSFQSEVLQLLSTASRARAVNSLIGRILSRGRNPSMQARKATRWAVVAEAAAAGGVARAWANGVDPYGFTAFAAATVAERLSIGTAQPGVQSPVQVVDATALLEHLAANQWLRWGCVKPSGS